MSISNDLREAPTSRRRCSGSEPAHRPGPVAVRLGLAGLSGLLIGALTQWLVLRVPFALLPLSNSAAPWIIAAFLVALTARSVRESLGLAVVALLAAIVGFYIAQDVRGWAVSGHQLAFWCAVTVLAGPVIGLAAGCLRYATRGWRALGAGVLGGLLIGEAVHGLNQPTFLSPHDYWYVQFGLGVALAITLATRNVAARNAHDQQARRALLLAASCAACAGVALVTAAAYQIA